MLDIIPGDKVQLKSILAKERGQLLEKLVFTVIFITGAYNGFEDEDNRWVHLVDDSVFLNWTFHITDLEKVQDKHGA